MKYKKNRKPIAEKLLQLYPNECEVRRLAKQLLEPAESPKKLIFPNGSIVVMCPQKEWDRFISASNRLIDLLEQ